ncbi:MAG: esterase [Acidobacteria bacterium]|nr:esterase [Acidobacteriota bacterium]
MRPTSRFLLAAIFLGFSLLSGVPAYGQAPKSFDSHEVHPDGSITFRYKDAGAKKVSLILDGAGDPLPMAKDKDMEGVWSIVTPPLKPEIYGYAFEVDGQGLLDPKNTVVKPNLLYLGNAVTVPGKTAQLWDVLDVPHGDVHHHFYTSKVVLGLADGQSEYFVYTPPNYDPKRANPYPVLYLLHGWSDLANGWTEVGEANFILDNLIAQGKAQPMIVVMPLGYGDMKFVLGGDGGWDNPKSIDHNVDLFTQALLTEVLPRVESAYHVSRDRNDRAITGLSMGGLESLSIGLSHSEQFAWVGGFSSAAATLVGHERLAKLDGKTADLRLLWIACGTDEGLIKPNRELISWLTTKGITATAIETPGMHDWMVWRDNLSHFAPLLFQKAK